MFPTLYQMNLFFPRWILPVAIGSCLLPAHAAPTTTTAGTPLILQASEGKRQEMVYYVWGTGDGRLVPTSRGFAEAVAPVDLTWWKPGTYQTFWQAVGTSGWTSDVKLAPQITVTGTPSTPPTTIPLSQVTADPAAGKISIGAQGELSWTGITQKEEFLPSSLTLPLGKENAGKSPYRIDWLVLTAPKGEGKNPLPFPQHFLIESAISPSGPWYPVASADFPFFPDPKNNGVWIPLRGLVAGSLRIVVPRGNPLPGGGFGWSLGSVRVMGGEAAKFGLGNAQTNDIAAWNNLWLNYGVSANEVHQKFDPWWETNRPLDGGMVCIPSCEWLGWGALKLSWLDDPVLNNRLESYIAGNPVGPDGYVWAAPGSEKHLGHSRHNDYNAIYPMAVAHHYLMRRDPAFLEMKDPATGESVLSKARRAMDYQLDVLDGRNGLIITKDPENDGTATSKGSNYWDFWLFGYKDAFGTAYFYESLKVMAEFESALGNEKRAEELRAIRPKVREAFNAAFWNEKAGRYIGWIDANGKRQDFGFTAVNVMALAYGLADKERAERVLTWLDGERTVEGDDSTGKDIYTFGFAPRNNTVEARRGSPPPVNTWGVVNIEPGGNGAYGTQIQNGGAIFFPAYYDLHARQVARGPEDVLKRWRGIETEFTKDQLCRDPSTNFGFCEIVGITREFPESGLVPYYFVDGLMGISPVAKGLRIAPQLPQEWPSATVRDFYFAGKNYSITADTKAAEPVVRGTDITVPASGRWLLTPDGKVLPEEKTTGAN